MSNARPTTVLMTAPMMVPTWWVEGLKEALGEGDDDGMEPTSVTSTVRIWPSDMEMSDVRRRAELE